MRTNRFTFKKTTKRSYKAISVDLTVSEAKELAEIIDIATDEVEEDDPNPVHVAMAKLFDALRDFVEDNGKELEL